MELFALLALIFLIWLWARLWGWIFNTQRHRLRKARKMAREDYIRTYEARRLMRYLRR